MKPSRLAAAVYPAIGVSRLLVNRNVLKQQWIKTRSNHNGWLTKVDRLIVTNFKPLNKQLKKCENSEQKQQLRILKMNMRKKLIFLF